MSGARKSSQVQISESALARLHVLVRTAPSAGVAADVERIEQIGRFRKLGLSLAAIRTALDRPGGEAAAVLERRLIDIDAEIETLRGHQRAIVALLQRSRSFRRPDMMTKERWVAIMRAAGFTEDDMRRWHEEFEKAAPDDHQEFLAYLHIGAEEITRIRQWSRGGR